MKFFDIVIIGGGLSGSSTALNLSKKGYSVLIVEKEVKRNFVCCAGGMAASTANLISTDINSVIESQVESVHFTWKSTDKVIADIPGKSPFWIVRREELDNLLLQEASKYGASIIRPTEVQSLTKIGEKWHCKLSNETFIKTKFLVIADGSESKWCSYLNLGPKKPKYARTSAIRLEGLGNISKNSVRFDFGSIKYGFAWAFPLKNSLNIGLGTFIGNNEFYNYELIEEILKGFGFRNINIKAKQKKLRIWNGIHNLNADGVLVVGDAASLCDPFLAEGIRPALISSFYASNIIDECLISNTYNLDEYSRVMKINWGLSMAWGKRIAEVFYRFPKTGYNIGIKRKTAPKRIAQILSGEMNYSDIANRVIKRLIFRNHK